MIIRLTIAASLLLVAPAVAQEPAPVPPTAAPAPKPATTLVRLETNSGPIVLELETERAPITAGNFLKYLDQKRLDGTSFYRASKVAPGFGLVQGGVRYDPKRVLPAIAHEPTSKTGLTHAEGTISMARAEPGSATGDFFIVVGDMRALDANPSQPGDNLGFAAFGRVAEGMEVVKAILDAPVSPTDGEGAMKGQMLSPAVKIVTARRISPPQP